MPTVGIGPLTLHTNDIGWQPARAQAFGAGEVEGKSYPASITGPGGLELDLAVFMSPEGEGMVHCPDGAGVPADYARLVRGARLGVYEEDDKNWIIKQLRLLRFSPETGWGNPSRTDLPELDELLGASVEGLLRDLGAVAVGTKSDVFGAGGNDLVLRWPESAGPEVPLAAYTLTRVLPIFRGLNP
jgi:hypothetical protein